MLKKVLTTNTLFLSIIFSFPDLSLINIFFSLEYMPDSLKICNGKFLFVDKFTQEFSALSLSMPLIEVGAVLLFSSTQSPL